LIKLAATRSNHQTDDVVLTAASRWPTRCSIGTADGGISLATAACEHYHSPVPLFATGSEAADHGQSGITAPDERARHHIAKIIGRHTDLTGPTGLPSDDVGIGGGRRGQW